MPVRTLLVVCLLALFSDATATSPENVSEITQHGPSFDCERARHRAEIMVCENEPLWALDRELNATYQVALKQPERFGHQLRADQLEWLGQVRNACDSVSCLRDAYLWRTAFLDEAPRFVARSDGLVLDRKTGLMWMRCSLGQTWDGQTCAGRADNLAWHKAMALAEASKHAGMDDWRLPEIHELETLVHCSSGIREQPTPGGFHGECAGDYTQPTIDTTVFPRAPIAYFWSASTAISRASGAAWQVYFNYGGTRNIGTESLSGANARLVRGGGRDGAS